MKIGPREPNPGDLLSATFLWDLVRYARANTPLQGPGILLKRTPSGTFISSSAAASAGTPATGHRPFEVRWFGTSGPPYSAFEIYLPPGCCSVNRTAIAINSPAFRETNGPGSVDGRKTEKDWYLIGSISNGQSGTVTVHVKTCAAREGIDQIADGPKTLMFAELHPDSGRTAAQIAADQSSCGDTLSFDVARIEDFDNSDGNQNATFKIRQLVSSPVFATAPHDQPFDLLHVFEPLSLASVRLEVSRMFVLNRTFQAAGATFVSKTLDEILTTVTAIYLKIFAATSPYSGQIVGFVSETGDSFDMRVPSNVAAQTGPYDVMVRLYRLDNCRIVEDDRSGLNSIQLYKA